jgi:hypothetical protein
MSNLQSPFGDDFKVLIQERIKNFWGYGNLDSEVWFVGMEEGYNETNEILFERFKATAHKAVFDIYDDLKVDPGHVYWFEENAPTQPTYRPLIYIQLYLQTRKEPTIEEIRQYQIKQFGRSNSDHAVLELMPLPSKSIKESDWLYTASGVEGLSSRKEYLATYKPQRVSELHTLIQQHKPKLVLFYSRTYLPEWQQIASVPFIETIPKKLHTAKDHDTLYAVVPHATSFGMSKNDWNAIAETIAFSLSHPSAPLPDAF